MKDKKGEEKNPGVYTEKGERAAERVELYIRQLEAQRGALLKEHADMHERSRGENTQALERGAERAALKKVYGEEFVIAKDAQEAARVRANDAIAKTEKYMLEIDRALQKGGLPLKTIAEQLHREADAVFRAASHATDQFRKEQEKFNSLVDKLVTPEKEEKVERLKNQELSSMRVIESVMSQKRAQIMKIGEEITKAKRLQKDLLALRSKEISFKEIKVGKLPEPVKLENFKQEAAKAKRYAKELNPKSRGR